MGSLCAAAVAAFIALSGCGGGASLPEVEGPTRDILDVEGGEFYYEPDRVAVDAGEVPVVLRNVGLVIHDLRIDGMPEFLVEARAGETATATWDLSEGRYEIYCSIEATGPPTSRNSAAAGPRRSPYSRPCQEPGPRTSVSITSQLVSTGRSAGDRR